MTEDPLSLTMPAESCESGFVDKEVRHDRRDPKRREVVVPKDQILDGAEFGADAKLQRLQAENEAIRRELADARLPLHDQLVDFAPVTAASRITGVAHNALQHAIEHGRLHAYELADGTKIVNLLDCRRLWPHGGVRGRGRPPKA